MNLKRLISALGLSTLLVAFAVIVSPCHTFSVSPASVRFAISSPCGRFSRSSCVCSSMPISRRRCTASCAVSLTIRTSPLPMKPPLSICCAAG